MSANAFTRQGYTIRFTAGTRVPSAARTCNGLAAGQAVASYFIAADPVVVVSGKRMRYFGTSSSATIHQSAARVRAYYGGSAVAPAKPIQQ
jgi:hypothetical protein